MSKKKKNMTSICAAYPGLSGTASRAERVAHFLLYYADEAPYDAVPPNIIHKTIAQLSRTPQKGSQEVLALASGMSNVQRLLKSKYNKLLITVKGVGYRVSIDDDDAAKHRGAISVKNGIAANARIEDDFAHINVAKIKDPTTKSWAMRVVKHLKEHNAEDIIKGILPPGSELGKKKDDSKK